MSTSPYRRSGRRRSAVPAIWWFGSGREGRVGGDWSRYVLKDNVCRAHALSPQRLPAPRSPLLQHRRHLHAGDAARNDPCKIREIIGHVEREPVPRDPLLHVDADARDLPASRPDARESRIAVRRDGENAQSLDERLLQGTQVPVKILLVGGKVENGVADELTGPMKRDVAAALDLEHVDAGGLQQMLGVGIPAQRHDRRVLQQQQYVVRQTARNPVLGELPLPLEGLAIRNRACRDNLERVHGVPVPLPTSPFPLSAHRVAMMPNTMFSSSQTIIPRMPKKRSSSAARKPIRIDPTAASTAITPRCQMLSSEKLRYHPTAPPTPTAAISPAVST